MSISAALRSAIIFSSKGDDRAALESANVVVRNSEASADELVIASSILRECGTPQSDTIEILKRAVNRFPDHENASISLFHALWEAERFCDAVGEITRMVEKTGTTCFEDIAKCIFDVCEWSLPDESQEHREGRPALESRFSRGLKPRYNSSRNPDDHLRGLEKKQQNIRSKNHKGLIESIEKSKQQLKYKLSQIDSVDDAHDSPLTYSREDEESDQ